MREDSREEEAQRGKEGVSSTRSLDFSGFEVARETNRRRATYRFPSGVVGRMGGREVGLLQPLTTATIDLVDGPLSTSAAVGSAFDHLDASEKAGVLGTTARNGHKS